MYNIDSFQKPNSTVFITHAHHDHLKGRHKKTCHVICTPTTRRLLGHIFPYKIKITTHAYFEVFEAANQAAVFFCLRSICLGPPWFFSSSPGFCTSVTTYRPLNSGTTSIWLSVN